MLHIFRNDDNRMRLDQRFKQINHPVNLPEGLGFQLVQPVEFSQMQVRHGCRFDGVNFGMGMYGNLGGWVSVVRLTTNVMSSSLGVHFPCLNHGPNASFFESFFQNLTYLDLTQNIPDIN